jgi:hypothetical protein
VLRTTAGGLGIVALLAAIVVGMLASLGAFGKKAPISAIPPGLEAAKATKQQTGPGGQTAATIGETVTVGDVSWTVTDANREDELASYTFPKERLPGPYVSIDFTVENVSERPVTLNADTITLFDAEGRKFRTEPDRNDAFIVPEKNLLFSEFGLLKPGETKEGKANFEVPENSSGFTASLGSTDPTTSEGVNVDLGF